MLGTCSTRFRLGLCLGSLSGVGCGQPRITGNLSHATKPSAKSPFDDNEGLTDPALTLFILEMRDVSIPPIERRFLPNKGWRQVTTRKCLTAG